MIRLLRLELPLAAGFCVLMGQVLALGRLPPLRTGILGFVCVFCLSASALILNDYFDYEVDLVNAPWRPLPSGMVTRKDVVALTVITTLVGLAAARVISGFALAVSVLYWIVGFLYNWRYKQSGLPGNLMVSFSVAGTFIFGAITLDAPWNNIVWTFSLMAFCMDLGEEIAGDAMDMEGDKKRGSRSIALLRSRQYALRIAATLWVLFILISFIPAVMGWMGTYYLVIILITDALLGYFTYKLLKSPDADAGHRAMRGAYMTAALCVMAFLIARFVG